MLNLVIHADHSVTVTKGILDGFIDIACIFDNREIGTEIADLIVKEREEAFVWVRSKNFVLRPGSPIPILVSPGDDLMIRTLTRNGLQYRIVFNSHDFHAKLSGIEAGIGVAAIPEKYIPPFLVRAREYYLPDLPSIKTLLCVRPGLESPEASELLKRLSGMFFKDQLKAAG
jgi:DNA-binding transcriptional LysR family regulator